MGRMSFPRSRMGLALLGVLLSACVTSAPAVREDVEAPEVVSSSWEEARADPSCVVPLCDEERCAIWRCQDVVEVDAPPGAVGAGRGSGVLRDRCSGLPWWSSPHPLVGTTPGRAHYATEPVFEIPWHNWKPQERARPRTTATSASPARVSPSRSTTSSRSRRCWPIGSRARASTSTPSPFAFPGASTSGCTVADPKAGSGMRRGDSSWRRTADAPPEEIWRFAGELMMRFGVNGPLVPYYCD